MAGSICNLFNRSISIIRRIHPFTYLHYQQTKMQMNKTLAATSLYCLQLKPFSTKLGNIQQPISLTIFNQVMPGMPRLLQPTQHIIQPSRNVTKYSFTKGKRKTVKAVVQRFFRLNSGYWIRPKAGRAKRLHKKSRGRKYRLRQHVFCNAQQCKLFDKMVSAYWKKPKYFVDDPYNPYHERHGLGTIFNRRTRWHEKN